MSKRKAAQAARANIREQLKDGTHTTQTTGKSSLKMQLHRVKEEPQDEDVDEESQFTWQHSPIPDEDREEVQNNTPELSGDEGEEYIEDGDLSATTSSFSEGIQKNPTSIVPTKLNKAMTSSQLKTKTGSAQVSQVKPSPSKKIKTNVPTAPANMKVKVIRACSKCTPIVMELAEQANKASKNSQELKRLMEDATRNVEKVKVILDDTFQKNKHLEEKLRAMQNSSLPLTARITSCDPLMRIYCGINMCNQFKWLAEKAILRLTEAELLKLKPINMKYSEQFLAVLMFLRSNPSLDELSHSFSFCFTEEEFWKMFSIWLPAIRDELKPRIMKPPNCILNTNFPSCFQSMGRNLQAIIHKFDIIREKSAVFDSWQTSPCLKCIVVMSPKGSVMGVSQVVDQTVPDTDLFTGSELDKLFSVANIIIDTQALGLMPILPFGIKVVEPPFDRDLEEEAVNHIETIVKKLLDFRILQGPIPRTMTKSMMDKVVTVCSGLLNLYDESFAYEPIKSAAPIQSDWNDSL